jgi:putative membrane protein
VCLAISAVYELIEWAAAVALGQGRRRFWAPRATRDTQSDMAMALLGAVLAQLLLAAGTGASSPARLGGLR